MKIIRKLFYTTLTTFIIISVLTITNFKNNTLRTNLEIENIINMKTNSVYLLNKDNYLTKVDIFLDKDNQNNQVISIVNYLKEANKKIESNYKGYIPSDTKILDLNIKNNILYLNLSKDFLKGDINVIIPGLVKSILFIKSIDKVDLKVNGNYIDNYNYLLDNKIPINIKYDINNRKNIKEVILYYLSKDNNYIPVTKYLNDDREKIEVIIEELKNNDNENLISYLNSNIELISYSEENDIYFLNFNKYLEDDKDKLDYNLNEIAYSIFDNYNVSSVMFKINNNNLKIIQKKKKTLVIKVFLYYNLICQQSYVCVAQLDRAIAF